MKIAVCDDEREIREEIGQKIRRFLPDAEVCLYGSAEELLAEKNMPELLFLDIKMSGMNGMALAEKLRSRDRDVTIIFLTALEEYVYRAFDVGAFHYMLKPVDPVRFYEVLERAVRERRRNRKPACPCGEREEESLTIRSKARTEKVYLSEIVYLEVFNRKVTLHKMQEQMEFYGRLKELEQRLNEDFVRCHRSYVVNLRYVRRYNGTEVALENGDSVLMAKTKYAGFVRCYMDYMKRREEEWRGTRNL
ncbi:MAG: LytTR family DNA-binding domain-containing protein [Clostridium sp.]|nr:LytTR family DNA-binding domain-containing protein [Clostridium sp.]